MKIYRYFFPKFALALLIIATIMLIIPPIIRMGLHESIEYNEGWNVYHDTEVAAGKALYSEKNIFTPVNYPPLSFYIVGTFGNILGDPLLAGRITSFLSLCILILLIFLITQSLGGRNFESIVVSIFILDLFLIMASHYIGMNEPQFLGHVFILSGMLIYLKSLKLKEDQLKPFLIALLFAMGLFIKQNLFLLPLAVLIHSFIISRNIFLRLISYLMTIIIIFGITTQVISHGHFLTQLTLPREYSIFRFLQFAPIILVLSPIILISLIASFYLIKDKYQRIASLYFFISLIISFYTIGGDGTNINMFFDLFFSIAIILGLSLTILKKRKSVLHIFRKPLSLYIILLFSLTFYISSALPNKAISLSNYKNLIQNEMETKEDISLTKTYKDPVLCETILLCYLSDKQFFFDPFLDYEMIQTGGLRENKVTYLISSKTFSLIQLENSSQSKYLDGLLPMPFRKDDRFTDNFRKAIGKYYHIIRSTADSTFYVPI